MVLETRKAVPVSYLVDDQGVVRDKFIAIDKGLLDEVVTPLLKERPAGPIPAEMRNEMIYAYRRGDILAPSSFRSSFTEQSRANGPSRATDAKCGTPIRRSARQFAGPALAKTGLLKAWARSNGSEAAKPTSGTRANGAAAAK